MSISIRLNSILQHYNYSANEFANAINVQRSNLSHIFSGRNKPSLDFIEKLNHKFPEISIEWFLFGTGTMLREENKTPTLPFSEINQKNMVDNEPLKIDYSEELSTEKNISNSQRTTERVIFIYNDKTFEEFSAKK